MYWDRQAPEIEIESGAEQILHQNETRPTIDEFTAEEEELNRRVVIPPISEIFYKWGVEEIDGVLCVVASVATPITWPTLAEKKAAARKQPKAEAYQAYRLFERGLPAEAVISHIWDDPPVQGTSEELITRRRLTDEEMQEFQRIEFKPSTKKYKKILGKIESHTLKPMKRDVTLLKEESLEIMDNECETCPYFERCWDMRYEFSVLYNDRHLCFKRSQTLTETGPEGQIWDTQTWLYVHRTENEDKRDRQREEILSILEGAGLTLSEIATRTTETPKGTVPKRLKELEEEGRIERDRLTKRFHAVL